jgi:hypothetical protein
MRIFRGIEEGRAENGNQTRVLADVYLSSVNEYYLKNKHLSIKER